MDGVSLWTFGIKFHNIDISDIRSVNLLLVRFISSNLTFSSGAARKLDEKRGFDQTPPPPPLATGLQLVSITCHNRTY